LKLYFTAILCLFFFQKNYSQSKYEVKIDLVNIKKDKVDVEVLLPFQEKDTITYCIPAIIPGTYARYDFGKFLTNFKAYDREGKRLKIKKKSINEFQIIGGKASKISYKVNDTWDANSKDNYVFQPAGTNIEKNKNVVLNHHGFIGYISGMQNKAYEIKIFKPSNFYCNTSIKSTHIDNQHDIEYANSYVHLADSPTLYCIADTVSFKCNNSKINIGVYSSSGLVKAEKIKQCITPLASALALFFNILPVNEYHFIFYFSGANDHKVWGTGASGALEHNYSSFYFMPEIEDTVTLFSFVKDVTAHEFLHILTPLNVHSYEIENFDFINPKMSQHLWMYEGVTEYFSQLVQLRAGLINEERFIENIHSKIEASAEFPKFSFTEMSRNVCIKPFSDYYDNVYQKGALLGFMLDIELSSLSNNKFGLPELMTSLTKKYGPDRPFKDDDLFDEIVSLTHPKIKEYFNDYIIESKPLPYQDLFDKIGWTYKDSLTDTVYNFGLLGIASVGAKDYYKVVKTQEDLNLFGLKSKDRIISINDKKVNAMDWSQFEVLIKPKTNKKVTVSILRNGKSLNLTAVPRKRTKIKKYEIKLQTNLTKPQVELRQKMFGNILITQ